MHTLTLLQLISLKQIHHFQEKKKNTNSFFLWKLCMPKLIFQVSYKSL